MDEKNLEELRGHIDYLDNIIIEALGERFRLAKPIADLKRALGHGIHDLEREEQVMNRVNMYAHDQGIPQELIRQVYTLVCKYMRDKQHE